MLLDQLGAIGVGRSPGVPWTEIETPLPRPLEEFEKVRIPSKEQLRMVRRLTCRCTIPRTRVSSSCPRAGTFMRCRQIQPRFRPRALWAGSCLKPSCFSPRPPVWTTTSSSLACGTSTSNSLSSRARLASREPYMGVRPQAQRVPSSTLHPPGLPVQPSDSCQTNGGRPRQLCCALSSISRLSIETRRGHK